MRILTRMLRQKGIYWEPTGDVDQFSQKTFYPPEQIKCRWEDVAEQVLEADAKETVFDATVFVDRDVIEGGIIMLGLIEDLESPQPPKTSQAKRIRKFEKIPTLKGTKFLRVAYL